MKKAATVVCCLTLEALVEAWATAAKNQIQNLMFLAANTNQT